MKERPILFSAPMVRALLDGTKTQTRRALRVQPMDIVAMEGELAGTAWCGLMQDDPLPKKGIVFRCKFGIPGDRLYVRETFAHSWHHAQPPYLYRASDDGSIDRHPDFNGWKPSIHMPRAASRIMLEIVSVRVERLNDCSEADAMAEGVTVSDDPAYYWVEGKHIGMDARETYAELWDAINGEGSADANPWVWVVEFKRVAP